MSATTFTSCSFTRAIKDAVENPLGLSDRDVIAIAANCLDKFRNVLGDDFANMNTSQAIHAYYAESVLGTLSQDQVEQSSIVLFIFRNPENPECSLIATILPVFKTAVTDSLCSNGRFTFVKLGDIPQRAVGFSNDLTGHANCSVLLSWLKDDFVPGEYSNYTDEYTLVLNAQEPVKFVCRLTLKAATHSKFAH